MILWGGIISQFLPILLLQEGGQMGKSLPDKNGKRRELGLGISQLKCGLYRGRFTKANGKTWAKESTNLKSLKDDLAEARFLDKKGLTPVNENTTLDEWFGIYYREYAQKLSPTTISSDRSRYENHLQSELGHRSVSKLKLTEIQMTFNRMKNPDGEPASIATKEMVRRILEKLLNKAVEADIAIKNVCRNIILDNYIPEEKEPMDSFEKEVFWNHWSVLRSPHYYVYRLAYKTGMRIGELCALKVDDVNLDGTKEYPMGYIEVDETLTRYKDYDNGEYKTIIKDPKSRKGFRKIPIVEDEVHKIILEQKKLNEKRLSKPLRSGNSKYVGKTDIYGVGKPEDFVFLNTHGRVITHDCISDNLEKIHKKIQRTHPDFRKLTMHIFRHTFATDMVDNGMLPQHLQVILGHVKFETTMKTYYKAKGEVLSSAMYAAVHNMQANNIIPFPQKKDEDKKKQLVVHKN